MLPPPSCAIGKYPLKCFVATAIPITSPLPITEPDPFLIRSGSFVSSQLQSHQLVVSLETQLVLPTLSVLQT